MIEEVERLIEEVKEEAVMAAVVLMDEGPLAEAAVEIAQEILKEVR